jgi:multisubunit Na+/H+ antiporter MnhE subunit
MEVIVAIRAIIEAIWRLVKIVMARNASPRRAIQAIPTRRKHDVSLEIALLKRATGACWKEVSNSCNSKRSYRMSVIM